MPRLNSQLSQCLFVSSQPTFLPPSQTSLIPNRNVARDQIAFRIPAKEVRARSNGQRTQDVLFAYYVGHKKGCWKSRRRRFEELGQRRRGFSLRNLSRIDKKLRDRGLIETSTGWSRRGRRMTNCHLVIQKPEGWKDFGKLNGKGITLRPKGHPKGVTLQRKPETSIRCMRLEDSAQHRRVGSLDEKQRRMRSFNKLNPKKFKPKFESYEAGYIQKTNDYMHRVRFWNSCQELLPESERQYIPLKRPKPRFKKTKQKRQQQERRQQKISFQNIMQVIRERNDGIYGRRVVEEVQRLGIG